MRWSLPLGRLFGIPIKVHVTLIVLLVIVGLMYGADIGGVGALVVVFVVTAAVFASVLVHELGHALVARRFGIPTREIVLHPIGGAAMLEREADKPLHELLIAVAGPLASLALAGIAFVIHQLSPSELYIRLAQLNLLIGAFNLLPAFPLDGGRVLRAGLTHWMGRVRATRIAGRLGRLTALGFIVVGFWYHHLILALIGGFVYIAAAAEERNVEIRALIAGRFVRDVMLPVRRIFGAAAPLDEVREALLADATARAVPVAFGDRVLGVLYREPVLEALEMGERQLSLNDLLDRNVITTSADEPLAELLGKMGLGQCRAALVMGDDESEIRGMVLIETVVEEIRRARDLEF